MLWASTAKGRQFGLIQSEASSNFGYAVSMPSMAGTSYWAADTAAIEEHPRTSTHDTYKCHACIGLSAIAFSRTLGIVVLVAMERGTLLGNDERQFCYVHRILDFVEGGDESS